MRANPPQDTLTAMLRAATAAAHRQLDSLPILVELAAGTIAPQRYRDVLAAFAPVWRASEPAAWTVLARRIPAVVSLCEERWRLLADDLAAFGGPAPERQPGSAPEIDSAAAAAGVLYVLEGARLGAKLIAERLARAGHRPGSPGYRFFAGASDIAPRWRRFRDLVDGGDWTMVEMEQACAAAAATFAAVAAAVTAITAHG